MASLDMRQKSRAGSGRGWETLWMAPFRQSATCCRWRASESATPTISCRSHPAEGRHPGAHASRRDPQNRKTRYYVDSWRASRATLQLPTVYLPNPRAQTISPRLELFSTHSPKGKRVRGDFRVEAAKTLCGAPAIHECGTR